ncbi:hypothetical protein FOB64_005900 [Candida albicans]|uniref:Uncharacterized protein n=1 Tax=Candida albicans TaxID=5476 RepID=A0A8H6F079_CANAX|nr:hypothetical protein FOB64_005900 [Candida albicans]
MSEKDKLKQQYQAEQQGYSRPEAPPPPYEEIQSQQNPYGGETRPQQGYDNKPYPDQSYQQQQQQQQQQQVNITLAPPEHLNPQYQEYLANEPDRFKRGDYPNKYYKHGAPLNEGHVNSSNKSNKGFPGRSGVTYHRAANS